ncbi:MAG: hypothetical protein ABSA41_06175 [Terriglobia bacterium]|jgi:hypothetical protein
MHPMAWEADGGMRVAITVTPLVTVGLSFDDEPTANSKDELTVATSGSPALLTDRAQGPRT